MQKLLHKVSFIVRNLDILSKSSPNLLTHSDLFTIFAPTLAKDTPLWGGQPKLGSITFTGGAFVIFPPQSTKISAGETMSNETTKNYVKSITTFDFPGCKCLVICGDIHGDFNMLVNKVCVQHQLKDALVIVAGDCGFGFERKGYYESTFNRNNKRMRERRTIGSCSCVVIMTIPPTLTEKQSLTNDLWLFLTTRWSRPMDIPSCASVVPFRLIESIESSHGTES